MYQHKLENLK